jgi:hypothetical protein
VLVTVCKLLLVHNDESRPNLLIISSPHVLQIAGHIEMRERERKAIAGACVYGEELILVFSAEWPSSIRRLAACVNYLDSARECVCFVRLFVCCCASGRRALHVEWVVAAALGWVCCRLGSGGGGGPRLDTHVSASHSLAAPPGKSPRPVFLLHTLAAKCAHAEDARNHSLSVGAALKSGRVTLTCRRLSLRQRKWIRTRFDLSPLLRSAVGTGGERERRTHPPPFIN